MENTNPAARLHNILSAAQTAVATNTNSGNAVNLWAHVFELATESSDIDVQTRVISRLLQLQELIEETEKELRRIDGLSDKYFRPFVRIRAVPNQSLGSLNSDISLPIRSLTEGDMTVLEFCSEKLEERHAEPIISEAELQEILQEVNSLFDDVKKSEIDSDLKTFVLDGLESIRRGIYEFRIRGPQRLRESLAEIVGSLAVNYDTVKAAQGDENVGKFGKIFSHLAAIVTFANTNMPLLTAVKVAFLPGA